MQSNATARRLDGPDYVDALIRRLRTLAAESDPRSNVSAAGKDIRAFIALETAGDLVSALAGWAVSHTIGLAKSDLASVPLQPSQTTKHPEYLSLRAAVDLHEHEAAGSKIDAISDPVFLRKALINLLKTNSGGWPFEVRHQVIAALEDLDYGKTSAILKPIKNGYKVGLIEKRHELRAVCFVEYRRGCGSNKEEAQQIVANAYGKSIHTIDTWADRLPKDKAIGHWRSREASRLPAIMQATQEMACCFMAMSP